MPLCSVCSAPTRASYCSNCYTFFQKTSVNSLRYKCWNSQDCEINYEYGAACRYCRFQKCLKMGLTENMEDSDSSSEWEVFEKSSTKMSNILSQLIKFQASQVTEHMNFFDSHEFLTPETNSTLLQKIGGKLRRRARAHDVNIMLKLGLHNAAEWGEQFEPFRNLHVDAKRKILLELGFAFILVDQGFKTAEEGEGGDFWLIQNDSFMHPNYFLGLSAEDSSLPNAQDKAPHHHVLVSTLLNCVARPFAELKVDRVECAALKSLILLTPSTPSFGKQESSVSQLFGSIINSLLDYCIQKGNGPERFEKVLSLIPLIRKAIGALHKQTKISDEKNFMKLDPYVKKVFCQKLKNAHMYNNSTL